MTDRPHRKSLLDVAWPRRTERLILRTGFDADVEATAIWAYRSQSGVSDWLAVQHVTPAALTAGMTRGAAAGTQVFVEWQERLIGDLYARIQDAFHQRILTGPGTSSHVEEPRRGAVTQDITDQLLGVAAGTGRTPRPPPRWSPHPPWWEDRGRRGTRTPDTLLVRQVL